MGVSFDAKQLLLHLCRQGTRLRQLSVELPSDIGFSVTKSGKPSGKYEATILEFPTGSRFKSDQYVRIRHIRSLRDADPKSHVISGVGLTYVEVTYLDVYSDKDKQIRFLDLENPEDILIALDDFARQHPGKPVSEYLKILVPDFEKLIAPKRTKTWVDFVSHVHPTGEAIADTASDAGPLPQSPPARWLEEPATDIEDQAKFKARRASEKPSGDTPPDFIKRHYGKWLNADGTGLTRPDIKRLDPSLYTALANWLRKNELPPDCPLPTKSHAITSTLNALLAQPEMDETALRRLGDAANYRKRRQQVKPTSNAR